MDQAAHHQDAIYPSPFNIHYFQMPNLLLQYAVNTIGETISISYGSTLEDLLDH